MTPYAKAVTVGRQSLCFSSHCTQSRKPKLFTLTEK